MTKDTGKETPAVEETKAAEKGPTEAEKTYDKLVHINTTGWDSKRLVAHRKKCAEALAAKRAVSQ